HPDFNTPETSHSGNIHGMPLSLLFGKGYANLLELFNNQKNLLPENTVLIGLRDIDAEEKKLLKQSAVTFYTMRDVDEKGIRKIMKEVFKTNFKTIEGLHLSFDLDVMNPAVMPGVSTPIQGGLTLREAHLILEMLYENQNIIAADFVELNPFNDIQGQSAIAASELICSLFGKTII
ncbi:MAG: arginase family protein, partial [Opitutaceae bacterium]|nr:arginase family protein [Cytophagales bacterium]